MRRAARRACGPDTDSISVASSFRAARDPSVEASWQSLSTVSRTRQEWKREAGMTASARESCRSRIGAPMNRWIMPSARISRSRTCFQGTPSAAAWSIRRSASAFRPGERSFSKNASIARSLRSSRRELIDGPMLAAPAPAVNAPGTKRGKSLTDPPVFPPAGSAERPAFRADRPRPSASPGRGGIIAEMTAGAAPLRVLIVDDEPYAREWLRQGLSSEENFEIVGEAGDGGAAVDAILRLKPDVVLLDVQMPGVDGFGVLDSIPDGDCPQVIFTTAFEQYAVRAFEAH